MSSPHPANSTTRTPERHGQDAPTAPRSSTEENHDGEQCERPRDCYHPKPPVVPRKDVENSSAATGAALVTSRSTSTLARRRDHAGHEVDDKPGVHVPEDKVAARKSILKFGR